MSATVFKNGFYRLDVKSKTKVKTAAIVIANKDGLQFTFKTSVKRKKEFSIDNSVESLKKFLIELAQLMDNVVSFDFFNAENNQKIDELCFLVDDLMENAHKNNVNYLLEELKSDKFLVSVLGEQLPFYETVSIGKTKKTALILASKERQEEIKKDFSNLFSGGMKKYIPEIEKKINFKFFTLDTVFNGLNNNNSDCFLKAMGLDKYVNEYNIKYIRELSNFFLKKVKKEKQNLQNDILFYKLTKNDDFLTDFAHFVSKFGSEYCYSGYGESKIPYFNNACKANQLIFELHNKLKPLFEKYEIVISDKEFYHFMKKALPFSSSYDFDLLKVKKKLELQKLKSQKAMKITDDEFISQVVSQCTNKYYVISKYKKKYSVSRFYVIENKTSSLYPDDNGIKIVLTENVDFKLLKETSVNRIQIDNKTIVSLKDFLESSQKV